MPSRREILLTPAAWAAAGCRRGRRPGHDAGPPPQHLVRRRLPGLARGLGPGRHHAGRDRQQPARRVPRDRVARHREARADRQRADRGLGVVRRRRADRTQPRAGRRLRSPQEAVRDARHARPGPHLCDDRHHGQADRRRLQGRRRPSARGRRDRPSVPDDRDVRVRAPVHVRVDVDDAAADRARRRPPEHRRAVRLLSLLVGTQQARGPRPAPSWRGEARALPGRARHAA